jgi:hypothetical protein
MLLTASKRNQKRSFEGFSLSTFSNNLMKLSSASFSPFFWIMATWQTEEGLSMVQGGARKQLVSVYSDE